MITEQSDIKRVVLIVDDDPSIRLMLGEALDSAGFRIEEAEDGIQALALLSKCTPDLILLDVMMPEMDGFEVCARIRDNPEISDIPIVIITGNEDLQSIKRAYDLGVTDFITKPIHWGGIAYRISFIIRATKAFANLRKSENRLLHAQRIAKIGNWELVLESDSIWLSDEARRILHLDPSDNMISYQMFIANIHPDDRKKVEAAVTDAIEHSGSYSIDHQLLLAGGAVCHLHSEAEVIKNWNAVPIRLEGTIQDITDRKKFEEEKQLLEQQFHQTQKLESLGVLAGGIAHDFNNILAIIIGYCSLVKMDYKTAEDHMPAIEKAVDRAAALCRQMLAYAGKAQIVRSKFNFRMLVGEMINMLKSTLPQNVEIRADLSAETPSINGDASQIRQIVMNMIINAAEAIGEEQGVIRVSLAKRTIVAGQSEKDYNGQPILPGSYLCLEVTDNGCGMDEETKWRIFEPFFTTKFTGRGLGMSAVLGIVMSHGGALQLFSQPGEGTTFKVYLPLQKSDIAEESPEQVSSAAWKGNGTILLVEDEQQVALVAKTMLEAMGFTVIGAENGKKALELYQRHAADITLVLSDIDIPGMDGYALFHELKKIKPGLPIIISSGFGDALVTSRLPREEMAGLISKPYSFDQLRKVLKECSVREFLKS
ncbi:MAG: response regulator [Desulfuromonadaceae bacterium]|nr:response regulator [Desulfuromonadaceae bacterium]